MYDINALRRKISKEGLKFTIKYLTSDNLPLYLKKELEENDIFRNGKLRMELLVS